MGFGSSSLSLLSIPTTSPISSFSAPGNAVWSFRGCCCCRTTVILGGVSQFDSRVPRAGSWRKRLPAISAAESSSVDAAPQSTDGATTGGTQAQSHLDLLQRMTENSTGSEGARVKTIRDQLASQTGGESEVALAQGEEDQAGGGGVPELTISQKRNIRRQSYLNKVSERNDAPFFAGVAAIVLGPPILILAVAVANGYVELFP